MNANEWTPLDLEAHESRLRSPEWVSHIQSIFGSTLTDQKQDLLTFLDSFDGVAYMHGVTPLFQKLEHNQYRLLHPETNKVLWHSPLFRKNSPLAKNLALTPNLTQQ